MRYTVAVAVMFMLAATVWGQMSPDEALERLRERQAAAATQPSTQPSTVQDALRDEIEALRLQNADLKAQVAALQKRLEKWESFDAPHAGINDQKVTTKAPGGGIDQSTGAPRTSAGMPQPALTPIQPSDIAPATWVGDVGPTRSAAAVISYINAHPQLTPDMIQAIERRQPAIGMPEDALNVILHVTVASETASTRVYSTYNFSGEPPMSITVTNGTVQEIDRLTGGGVRGGYGQP